ncbi:MAG: preprotein translocase subunit YajC [Halomonas sp.]|uniref:preprotein translocase subunit YajC n=1 Tax=Halomonas sp. TaxID=1486246 RepID=UPI002ACD6DBC|nr:preprotein translocase subunit YajC [Halomonas sp.]MDZ7853561.1 preprotein translocase subunit YajC [Halomonas sp.]MDZ7854566.1 preprotein translocase subunit YajC [Halomonas sp.]
MAWVIIFIAVMLVISPVLWLKPNPRQKRVAQMRTAMSRAGVTVKLDKPPFHEARGVMPHYRWPYPPQQPGPDFTLVRDVEAGPALKPFRHGWYWRFEPLRPLPEAAEAPLEALLTRLPLDAKVLESNRAALGLWWWESQDAERFSSYLEDFAALRDALAGHPDQPGKERPLDGPRG